jgi:hypothetical protein
MGGYQMAYYYISNFEFDPISLVMIFAGYGIATAAGLALGLDRTYFGVELGANFTPTPNPP